jgi:hypothetical protein
MSNKDDMHNLTCFDENCERVSCLYRREMAAEIQSLHEQLEIAIKVLEFVKSNYGSDKYEPREGRDCSEAAFIALEAISKLTPKEIGK